MSFTPPTRPMMMQPGYGYPPMIPPPGMMQVRPPLLPPGMPPLKSIVERAQATTVFVGNISERAPDPMMRQMLQKCGNVLNWKRATGAGGKLQTFGFCEYDNPDATLRCIRLLNGYEIADKKISVKVDQKTRDLLSEHIKKLCAMDPTRRRRQAPDDDNADINLEYVDENNLKEDRAVLNSFETIIRTYAKELAPPEPAAAPVLDKPAAVPCPPEETAKSPAKRRVSSPPAHRHERSRSGSSSRRDLLKENRPETESDEQKERRRLERKLREKEMAYRERLEAWEQREQKKKYEYSAERKKEAQRQKTAAKEAKKLRQFLQDYDDCKDDPVYFKAAAFEKKVKAREKEIDADHKDRQRERDELDELRKKLADKGVKDFDSEAKRIQNDESHRLRKLLEGVDESEASSSDEEDDHEPQGPEAANGTAQLSDLNPNKQPDEQHKPQEGVEAEEKAEEEEEETAVVAEQRDEDKNLVMTPELAEASPLTDRMETPETSVVESPMKLDSPRDPDSPLFSGQLRQNINLTTAVRIRAVQREKSAVVVQKNQLFAEEEEEQTVAAKKARMVFNKSVEEKRRAVKKLVESIPADRDQLFSFAIDWSQLDDALIEKRIRPWINKKIIEYIGEEEESLNDYICAKIRAHTAPERLLDDVKVMLDEESELFVKKMWRLLVYETEAKRLGIQSKI